MIAHVISKVKFVRLLSQHSMDETTDSLPPELRCTGQKLSDSGAYVVGKCY